MRRRQFFEQVPQLFPKANHRLWETYEETLFSMRRPLTHGNYWIVRRYVGGNPPQSAIHDARVHRDLDRVLANAKYPDAGALDRLEEFTEANVEFATALLHFYNPAYPILDEPTVRGLEQLGVPASFTPQMEDETVEQYQTVIDAIQELKDAIPFYCVPEKNYYLTRIIQECLWQVGVDQPNAAVQRKAPSRRAQGGA